MSRERPPECISERNSLEQNRMEETRSFPPANVQLSAETVSAPPERTSTQFLNISRENFPSEQTTLSAVSCFLDHIEPMFHIIDQARSEYLLQSVYHGSNSSEADVCELCAVAAAGSQYKSDLSQSDTKSFFYHSYSRLPNLQKDESVQAIKATIGLSLCANLSHLITMSTLICTFPGFYGSLLIWFSNGHSFMSFCSR